ncbi:MAG: hypothetical protein K2X03_15645 [Bryobacteraceae bacterium]|nr:hypothetical protein [Bryobacteraceae bacterium]
MAKSRNALFREGVESLSFGDRLANARRIKAMILIDGGRKVLTCEDGDSFVRRLAVYHADTGKIALRSLVLAKAVGTPEAMIVLHDPDRVLVATDHSGEPMLQEVSLSEGLAINDPIVIHERFRLGVLWDWRLRRLKCQEMAVFDPRSLVLHGMPTGEWSRSQLVCLDLRSHDYLGGPIVVNGKFFDRRTANSGEHETNTFGVAMPRTGCFVTGSSEGWLRVWAVPDLSLMAVWRVVSSADPERTSETVIRCLAGNDSLRLLGVGTSSGAVHIYSLAQDNRLIRTMHYDATEASHGSQHYSVAVTALALSGEFVMAGYESGLLRAWRISDGAPAGEVPPSRDDYGPIVQILPVPETGRVFYRTGWSGARMFDLPIS